MKNLIQYLKLWRKKRDELQINKDTGENWLQMQELLDKHMPVDEGGSGSSIKKRGINLVSMMFITLAAAAMVFTAVKVVQKRKHQAEFNKHRMHRKGHGLTTKNDSIAVADSSRHDMDSLVLAAQSSIKNDTIEKTLSGNNKLPYKSALAGTAANGKSSAEATPYPGKSVNASSAYNSKHLQTRTTANPRKQATNKNIDVKNNADQGKDQLIDDQHNNQNNGIAFLDQPRRSFDPGARALSIYPVPYYKKPFGQIASASPAKSQKNKIKNNPGSGLIDWGLLLGANSNGSFTAKGSNSNFYGSSPVDIFVGAYATFNLNPKWGIGTEVKILSPVIAKGGTYARTYLNYTDSITTLKSKNVSDSKKIYSVQIPLYAVYHLNNNIGFKAGPVINIPVKQVNISPVDSVSHDVVTHSHYDQKMDYNFAGGVSYRYKMFILEATYLKGLTSHSIVSDSLVHKSTNNTFQFTIKFQLGGNKK